MSGFGFLCNVRVTISLGKLWEKIKNWSKPNQGLNDLGIFPEEVVKNQNVMKVGFESKTLNGQVQDKNIIITEYTTTVAT